MKCPHCGSDIPFGIKRCTCGYQDGALPENTRIDNTEKYEMEEIPPPDGFELHQIPNGIEIVRRWFDPTYIGLIFAVLFSFGMTLYFTRDLWLSAPLFLVLPILGVAGFSYYIVAGLLNRTYVSVDSQGLTIRHEPIPWFGGKTIETSRLKQLYSKEIVSRGESGPHVSYELRATLKSGGDMKLLAGLASQQQALYIEQELEKHLGIKDAHVDGEISR